MIEINHPTIGIDRKGREAECERALNAAFYALIRRATEAGWDVPESANAIAKIAQRCAQQPPADEFDWVTGEHIHH
jgi:hypothetical protein